MVNDITTLNGALSQLGETLASNITQKGVSASASDGLTTLANKVLQISGGGSTVYYQNDFSDSSTISDFTDGQGTITKSISNGELVLTAPNNDGHMTYCNKAKLPYGDWKVTINSTTYNSLALLIGYDPNEPNNTCFDITWNYGWGLKKIGANWSETSVKTMSRISLGTNGVWEFEYIDKVMKIYQNDTLKATYDLTSYDTIGGYVVIGNCCNRTNNISELIIEELGSPYSPCSEYIEEINNAIEYINGDGT